MKSLPIITLLFLLSFISYAQELSNSNLPIVIINTDINPNTGRPYDIPDEPKVPASMKIIFRPDGSRNYINDQYTTAYLNYNGRIAIERRGSSSQILQKKPYGVKTLMSDNFTNNNAEILGMPKENDWVLNSLAYDPSLIRNYLSYDLARSMGNYSARGVYCEVVINGDYKGLYIFMEKIKVDDNRINIVKMTSSDNNLPELSGGYVTKADKTTGGDPIAWSMQSYAQSTNYIHENPSPREITTYQNNYIHNLFNALQNAATLQNTSLINGYPSIIDVPSFLDFIIINELASNADGYQFSTYFHKDRNGKLRAGPVWDFDLTYGNDLFHWNLNRSFTYVWQFNNGDNTGSRFWRDLYNTPTFKCYLTKRWKELTATNGPLNYSVIAQNIDRLIKITDEAAVRENQRWGTVPGRVVEIAKMKQWIQERMSWLNANLNNYSSCANPVVPQLVITKINYNPVPSGGFSSDDLEFIEITNKNTQTADLTGVYFSQLGISYQFPSGSTIAAGKSIILAGKSAAFEKFYGRAAFGEYTRNLSNKSEKIVISDAFGNLIDSVRYHDNFPWPVAADGGGYFLTLREINADNGRASNWTVSSGLTVGSNTIALETSLTVFPNPAKSKLTVESNQNQFSSFDIFDLSGRKINVRQHTISNRITIEIENLIPGIYVIKLNFNNGESVVRKFVKTE